MNTEVEIAFPPRLAEGLADASADELADIEISPAGLGLHWPKLDIDLYVPALLEGVFGSKRWMAAQLGAAGGRAQSPAKTEAARENGRKGGRPRKLDPLAKLTELVMATYDARKPAKAKLTADERRALAKELKIANPAPTSELPSAPRPSAKEHDPHRHHFEAVDAIAAKLPLGSGVVEPNSNRQGEREIWLEPHIVDQLRHLRHRIHPDLINLSIEMERRAHARGLRRREGMSARWTMLEVTGPT